MEMRLFDAPLDHYESAMQMKLVRALLDTALNGTEGLSGNVRGLNMRRWQVIMSMPHESWSECADKSG